MVMFSELRRYRIRDQHTSSDARLTDLVLSLAGEYPTVERIVLRRGLETEKELPWSAVASIDWGKRRVIVKDLDAAQPVEEEANQHGVRIDRDVMDALILDVPRRQSMRANDLWLELSSHGMFLRAADISPWAVLRRLARGVLGRGSDHQLLDWLDVEFLRGDPQAARDGRDYHRRVAQLHPAEIAHLLDAVPYLHAAELLTLLEDDLAADTLEVMNPERQIQVFEELEQTRQLKLVALMAPEHAADLIARLGPDIAREILEALPVDNRDRVIDLLRYPEGTAGGIMTNDVVMVAQHLTIVQGRASIRERLLKPDFIYYIYVVEDLQSRRLVGVLTLRDLLIAKDDERIADRMRASVDTLDPLLPATQAAQRVAEHNLAALPVVGREGRLLGAVTADAAVVQLTPPSLLAEAPRVFT